MSNQINLLKDRPKQLNNSWLVKTKKETIKIDCLLVIPMVRLSNHFLEDLEKLAKIYKGASKNFYPEIQDTNLEFKTKYNTAQMIEHDISVEKRKRGIRKSF